MKALLRYGRNVLGFLSITTFESYSEQPSEDDELDPTSRLDSSCLTFVQNFVFTESSYILNESLNALWTQRFKFSFKHNA